MLQLTYHSRRGDKLGAGIHGWKLERGERVLCQFSYKVIFGWSNSIFTDLIDGCCRRWHEWYCANIKSPTPVKTDCWTQRMTKYLTKYYSIREHSCLTIYILNTGVHSFKFCEWHFNDWMWATNLSTWKGLLVLASVLYWPSFSVKNQNQKSP